MSANVAIDTEKLNAIASANVQTTYGYLFNTEAEWMQYVEETDTLVQVHGAGFALKLMREMEKQYADNKHARYDVREIWKGI